MSCELTLSNIVITLNLIISKDKTKLFACVGDKLNDDIKKILYKIENNKSISESEEKNIKKLSTSYKKWIKGDVKFIYHFIRLDDSINTIKKKIFLFTSNLETKYFVNERNQEIWIEPLPKKYKILGYHYVNKDSGEEVKIEPSIYSKVEIDYKFVDKDGLVKEEYDLINEDLILYDAIDISNDREHEIYISNLNDFIKRLEKHKISAITDKLLNGYIKKYWPEPNLNITVNENLKHYKEIKINIERDNKIINLINNATIEKDQFSACNMIHARIHINYGQKDGKIDLLKLFNYLRKNLSYDMPFIKYKDPDWDKPYSVVYDKSIKEKLIDEGKLMTWLYIKKDKNAGEIKGTKGISVKIKIYTFNNKLFYGTLVIYKDARLEFTPSYIAEYGATIYNIIDNIKDVAKLIQKINKSDIIEDDKINYPDINLVNNILITKKNTKIVSLSTISDYKPRGKIGFNDLYNFSKLFTPFITYKLDKPQSETRLTLVYKRVSNFINMTDIYKYINEQINYGRSEYNIIADIVEKFDKTVKQATLLLSDFRKRYGGYSSYNLMKQTGIPSCINFNTNRITVNGASEFFLLVNANKFITAMISIYENRALYKKNKDFRELILSSNEYIKLYEKELKNIETNIDENIDEDLDIEDLEDLENIENIENDINIDSNINVNKYLESLNKNEEVMEKEEIQDYIADLASDAEIGKDVQLTCEDAIPELDTCRDLCNDRSYFLRRLQRHDPKLFNFTTPYGKYKKYSKACQASDDVQPVVMKSNPEDNPNIDSEAFTYALKYGSTSTNQNYYICPKVWCPYCQIPILLSKVKNIRTRRTVEGECTVGRCPNGDHEVFIMTKNHYKSKKFDEGGLYPGFVATMHPDGLCLPCCFVKPQNIPSSGRYGHFKKCLGEEVKTKAGEENIRYVLGNVRFVPEGRYALLPPDIAKLYGSHCKQGLIEESCFLRKGVEYKDNQGFLMCIGDIISDERPITLNELKDYLIDKLTPKLFRSLNGGALEILFKKKKITALENFKEYLQSDEKIDEKYLWDYLSRRDVLYPEGVNIIIFTEETLICPLGFNVKEFYNLSKRTIIMIKYLRYYTPIYYLKYDEGEISVQKYFSTLNKVILNTLMILQNNCIQTSSINWKRILKDNQKKYKIEYDIELEKEISLTQTIKLLDKSLDKSYKLKSQIIDFYNKTIGLLLENGTYLPVLPSSISVDYDIIIIDKLVLLPYTILKKNLEYIDKRTKINCKPIHKILSKDGKSIVAIILDTGRMVPVKSSLNIKDNLTIIDIPYYSDANKVITEGTQESDTRMEIVNRMEYEAESYNRLRYELSKYLVKNQKEFKKIKEIIDSDDKLEEKRKDIRKILTKIFQILVNVKDRKIDFSKYQTPNIRTLCYDNKDCDEDPHCIKEGNKCKLHIFSKNLLTGKNNMHTYIEILSEELIRNRMKREDILDDKISEIIDKQKLVADEDEIIFFGKYKDDYEKLNKLYHKEQHIYINDVEPFDTTEPKFYGINKEYIEVDTAADTSKRLENLSGYWKKILGENYLVFVSKDSTIFDAISHGLNYIYKEPEDKQTPLKLRQRVVDYDIPEDMILKIAKDLNLKLDIENNDEQDLILKLYKKYSPHIYKTLDSVNDLKSYILRKTYEGSVVDIYILSHLYKINIIILDKRIKGSDVGLSIIRQPESKEYIILYTYYSKDRYLYNIVEKRGKYVFEKYDFSDRFRELIDEIEEKQVLNKNVEPIKRKIIKIRKRPIEKSIKIRVSKRSPKNSRIKTRRIKIKKS